MFLIRSISALGGIFLIAGSALASEMGSDTKIEEDFFQNQSSASATTQMGYDYWNIERNTISGAEPQLFLADSSPQWKYRSFSPWLNFNGSVQVEPNTVLTLKMRASQSSNFRMDELSADYSISPSLGVRLGVLDYKTSWCRRYDVDSPWVRENDPFCNVRTTERSIAAAPGMQAYVRTNWGPYQTQAVAGLFRPTLGGYDKKEFTNFNEPKTQIEHNRKTSVAINAINAETGTEVRLSWQGTDQAAILGVPGDRYIQKVNLFYGGASFYLVDGVSVRFTYLKSKAKTKKYLLQEDPDRFYPLNPNDIHNIRVSRTMELNYQVDAANMVSLAASNYTFNSGSDGYFYDAYPNVGLDFQERSRFKNESYSISWRRDWRAGVYTGIQWTHSKSVKRSFFNGNFEPEYSSRGNAHALGVRLGYRF